MTRAEFEKKAIREAERKLHVPAGWWGTWCDVRGPGGYRVHRIGRWGAWRITRRGTKVSDHDSRSFAIKKAASGAGSKKR